MQSARSPAAECHCRARRPAPARPEGASGRDTGRLRRRPAALDPIGMQLAQFNRAHGFDSSQQSAPGELALAESPSAAPQRLPHRQLSDRVHGGPLGSLPRADRDRAPPLSEGVRRGAGAGGGGRDRAPPVREPGLAVRHPAHRALRPALDRHLAPRVRTAGAGAEPGPAGRRRRSGEPRSLPQERQPARN